jgi:hypothetical protein
MRNIFLLLLVSILGCRSLVGKPQLVNITIENPQPSTGACPDGVQVTFSKGVNSWTSPLVTETQFSFGASSDSSTLGFLFVGDRKVDVSVLCKKSTETGIFKAVWQTTVHVFGIYINTNRPYQTFPVDDLYVLQIAQESLPLPQIEPKAY